SRMWRARPCMLLKIKALNDTSKLTLKGTSGARWRGRTVMLRITTEKKRGKVVLTVEGKLAGQWTAALEECWRHLRADSPGEKFNVNLCGVSFIDAAGKILLRTIHRDGG